MTCNKLLTFSFALLTLPAMAFAENTSRSQSMTDKGSNKLHQSMQKSQDKMSKMQMSGDIDKDFAQMMADHHRSAIEMAQIQAEYGNDKELKQLAQKIVTTQKQELSVLERHAGGSH